MNDDNDVAADDADYDGDYVHIARNKTYLHQAVYQDHSGKGQIVP